MEINDIEDGARAEFLQAVADNVKFWVDLPNKTDLERCNGVAFSIMVTLDEHQSEGCIYVGNSNRELHAEYGKYKPRSEPGIGKAFTRLIAGLIRHIFGKR
jgi:hypothetical protein